MRYRASRGRLEIAWVHSSFPLLLRARYKTLWISGDMIRLVYGQLSCLVFWLREYKKYQF